MANWMQACALAALLTPAAIADWPAWRGPRDSGATGAPAPVTTWTPGGEGVVWSTEIGGRNTPIVMNGRVFFNAPVDVRTQCSGERVVCLDAATGRLIWERRFNVFYTDIVENRVGWASLVGDPETGNVYVHGTGGELICFSRDGDVAWKRSLTEEFGRISGYGGRLFNPIVDEDRVLVSIANSSWGEHARGGHRILALDKNTGAIRWWSDPAGKPPSDTTYATPVVGVIGGKRLLIAPNADGYVYALHARTGETVWKFALSKLALNSSPVVVGDRVYVGHGEENFDTTEMGRLVCINGIGEGDITKTHEIWRADGIGIGYASPAVSDSGRVYAVDNSAMLFCIDANDGRVVWQFSLGRVGKGSPVVTSDGVIYVGEQNGVFHILRDDGDHATSLSRVEFPPKDGAIDELYGSPAVSGGRVYFTTRYGAYCLGGPQSASESTPAAPGESDSSPAVAEPVFAAVVPAEITLTPGDSAAFALHVYGADRGRPQVIAGSSAAELKWSVEGLPATIGPDGTLSASDAEAFAAGVVKAKYGSIEAAARVRILPKLPIAEPFDDLKQDIPPPGWVSAGGRVKIVQRDGTNVLVKLAGKDRPSPPFMRLQTFFTPLLPASYTVECDMMSDERDAGRRSFLPDMGLLNSRYLMQLSGADRKSGAKTALRIESWGAVPRVRADAEFDWSPGVWYRVKFRVEIIDGKGLCRAKVWPRDKSEPAAWQIELSDPCPNAEGSAGLYCYSNGTTSKSDGPATYFDNVKVYPNE